MTSGGFVIAVRNNSFIDSKIAFFRSYLVTIFNALVSFIFKKKYSNLLYQALMILLLCDNNIFIE
jgi:hypothetical protein